MSIETLLQRQREFFQTGKTRDYTFRKAALERLEHAISRYESAIMKALHQDLHKSEFESYMTEVGMVRSELTYVKKHLKDWMRDKTVPTPLAQFQAKSFVKNEPYGVVMIMAPWNYPFQLCIEPLISALAAGNCCIIKPSAYAPATSAILARMTADAFPQEYVVVVEGGRTENSQLLEQRFDYIFFTGGVQVGKMVMEKASKHLIPVTLELGGKSPCIVEESANLKVAAKRLVFGKYLNSGQTCVAPDYLLVQASVKKEFLVYVKEWIHAMLGDNPLSQADYPKMINEKHYQRVVHLLEEEEIIEGGNTRKKTLQIAPTIVDHVSLASPLMQEEIFGPVLPVLTFETIQEAKKIVRSYEKPLALYLFTENQQVEKNILVDLSFGGGCVNDTIIHLATPHMGFGGVGGSGMGSYHGKAGFTTFSHQKSIVKKATWVDIPIRYQPYTKRKSKLLHLFLK